MTSELTYFQNLMPKDECAKHGKEWIFKKKNPPSTETEIYIDEYSHYCVICIMQGTLLQAEKALELAEGQHIHCINCEVAMPDDEANSDFLCRSCKAKER